MKKILFFCVVFMSCLWSDSLSQIRSKGVLKVGVDSDLPPFSKMENGKFSGFEINFAEGLAKKIFDNQKGEVEFISVPVNERISVLQDNKVDLVIDTLSITDDRKEYIDFSIPYLSTDTAVLTRKQDNIKSIADLKNKRINIQKGTAVYDKLKNENGYKLILCNLENDCYKKLKNNKGDGFISDNTVLLVYAIIDSDVELGVKTYGHSDMIGVGVKKGNKDLLNFVNSSILKLSKEGFFKKAFKEELNPFYKGKAGKKYFLLDDLYSILGRF